MRRAAGQASLESTVGLVCGLLLLMATVKVFFWFAERLLRRQIYYEATRGCAGAQGINRVVDGPIWNDPVAVANPNNPNDPARFRMFSAMPLSGPIVVPNNCQQPP